VVTKVNGVIQENLSICKFLIKRSYCWIIVWQFCKTVSFRSWNCFICFVSRYPTGTRKQRRRYISDESAPT